VKKEDFEVGRRLGVGVEYEYGYGYTSILENILNITPSGVIVGSDTFGVVDIDMDIDIDIDEDADIDSVDDAFST
jgi:hypothetical protein